jgi:hypothetical protein
MEALRIKVNKEMKPICPRLSNHPYDDPAHDPAGKMIQAAFRQHREKNYREIKQRLRLNLWRLGYVFLPVKHARYSIGYLGDSILMHMPAKKRGILGPLAGKWVRIIHFDSGGLTMGCLAGEVHVPDDIERTLVPRDSHFSKNNGSPQLLGYLATCRQEVSIGGVKHKVINGVMVSTRLPKRDFMAGQAGQFPEANHVVAKDAWISRGEDGKWTVTPRDEHGKRFIHEGELSEFEWVPVGALVACFEKDKFPRYAPGHEYRMERTSGGWKKLTEWAE